MIKVPLTNEILKYITEIDKNRYTVSSVKLSKLVANRLRKNSKKKSSYASNELLQFVRTAQKSPLKAEIKI